MKTQWYLLDNEADYNRAVARFEEIYEVELGHPAYKEALLLGHLIAVYEQRRWDLPELDPIALVKVRMEEFGFKAKDLATDQIDKGNLSKVLNYRRALTLEMIRSFSKRLKIPASYLVKDYQLRTIGKEEA